MSWNPDKFQKEIGELLAAFNAEFLSGAAKHLSEPNGEQKQSLQVLSNLDVVQVQKRLDGIISQIELELRRQCQQCMTGNDYLEKDIRIITNNYFYTGCIRSKVIGEINSTISQLNNLVIHARVHLEILNRNSGLCGFLKGLFTGYTNPIDGVAHALGKGSIQMEVGSSTQGFNTTALLAGQSIDAVSQFLKVTVLETWNAFGAYLEDNANCKF
ncbi:hypothetical protein EOE67_14775 [Rheinheimera riviphila]|uniref:Uncharacterized protein n=1 Tax=Rheinheimera riviphila TaxID=1834037 RepID=A0A437QIZ4_9GAMM|nr:hypothetical protein [Rheinheimera riviphila]RVU34509.1 hypothetical protein EOE67_14775 [Rheinheimera riviphila]